MATNILYYYDNASPDSALVRSRVQSAVTTWEGMETANAQGGLRLWVIPRFSNRRHFAWNPITFEVYQFVFNIGNYINIPSGATQYDVSVAGSHKIWLIKTLPIEVSLPLYDSSGALRATLKADTMQGCATFNIAPIVRNWFSEPVSDPVGYNFVVKDTAQSTKCRVYVDNGTMHEYYIQNAVSQVGSDGDKSFSSYEKLTDDYKLIRWDFFDDAEYGYYTFRCPICSIYINGARTITYDRCSVSLDAGSVYRFYVATASQCAELNAAFSGLNLQWENREYFEDGQGGTCSPYPIRWVNRKGGIDQYLFLHRQFKTKESKTTGLREIYTDNTGTINSNRRPYAVEGSRIIKVGAERISADVLDLLTKMPYSPHIEWCDLAQNNGHGIWSGVNVSKFSNTEQTDAACHDFEIEFECPAINMQFE